MSARAKQLLEDAEEGVVPDEVRGEIERITGVLIDPSARLSDSDGRFIRTQQEMVD